MESFQASANSFRTSKRLKYTAEKLAEIERIFESFNVEDVFKMKDANTE